MKDSRDTLSGFGRDGSINIEQIDQGRFPLDIWDISRDNDTGGGELTTKPGWSLRANIADTADDLTSPLSSETTALIEGVLTDVADVPDTWHYVNTAGEPAFENGWNNYSVSWQYARFIKQNGVVYIEGMVTGGTLNKVVFTLPEGYRPDNDIMFNQVESGANGTVRLDIKGVVHPTVPGAVSLQNNESSTWVNITCSFRVEESTPVRGPQGLQGDIGLQGDEGPQGPQGELGYSFIAPQWDSTESVTEGAIRWYDDYYWVRTATGSDSDEPGTTSAWTLWDGITDSYDTWHYVGESGEPAFQNGWVNFDPANWQVARFIKQNGIVYIEGMIKGGTLNSVVFTLPTGYRPEKNIMFSQRENATDYTVRVDILTATGDVSLQANGSNGWVNITCSFRVEESTPVRGPQGPKGDTGDTGTVSNNSGMTVSGDLVVTGGIYNLIPSIGDHNLTMSSATTDLDALNANDIGYRCRVSWTKGNGSYNHTFTGTGHTIDTIDPTSGNNWKGEGTGYLNLVKIADKTWQTFDVDVWDSDAGNFNDSGNSIDYSFSKSISGSQEHSGEYNQTTTTSSNLGTYYGAVVITFAFPISEAATPHVSPLVLRQTGAVFGLVQLSQTTQVQVRIASNIATATGRPGYSAKGRWTTDTPRRK